MRDRWQLSQPETDQLVNRLLNCPSLNSAGGREDVLARLPERIRNTIREGRDPRAQVTNAVETCLRYPWGLEQLLDAVHYFESGLTYQMRAVYELLGELRPQPVSPVQLVRLRDHLQDVVLADKKLRLLYRAAAPNIDPPTDYIPRPLLACMLDSLALRLDAGALINFVTSLAEHVDKGAARAQVLAWVAEVRERSEHTAKAPATAVTLNQALVLMIALLPLSGDEYKIRAWVWGGSPDRMVFEADWPNAMKRLGELLLGLLDKIAGDIEIAGVDPLIEFYLPLEQIDAAVEQEILERDETIGFQYRVVVRFYERAFSGRLWAKLKVRWKALKCDAPLEYQLLEKVDDERELRALLDRFPCLVLACEAKAGADWYRCMLDGMLSAGTPIALWPRRHPRDVADLAGEMRDLLPGDALDDLPTLVWEARRAAWVEKAEDRLGRYLTLILDDGDRSPKSLSLTLPSA